MATTGQNFVKLTNAALVGAANVAAGQLVALNPSNATQIVNGSNGSMVDKTVIDLSTDALAKHGAARHTLSGTTTKTFDLTDLTSTTASNAGDTTFASFSTLVFFNDGAASCTIASGASNGASLGFAGTTPTLTVQAGQKVTITYASPVTVDGTHKTIDITPTSGGSFVLAVGGA